MINVNLRIAIDGGVGTGKSTISKLLSKELNLTHINTGEIYRLVALYINKNNLESKYDHKNETIDSDLLKQIKGLNIDFGTNGSIKADFDFTISELHLQEQGMTASYISSIPELRNYLTSILVNQGKKPNILLEGRDIGTVVMKDASFKFYLTVSSTHAAKRKYDQLEEKTLTLEEVEKYLNDRNKFDTTRKLAPLKKAQDAIEINTTNLTPNQIINKMVSYIKNEK